MRTEGPALALSDHGVGATHQAETTRDGARTSRRYGQILGALLLAHFATLCAIKLNKGLNEEILWVSHLSLALTGVGLWIRSTNLIGASFTLILFLHALWLVDCFCGLVLGRFPLGITDYLVTADAWTWIGTAHHFYLAPLLLAAVARSRVYSIQSIVLAIVLFGIVSVVSRVALPEASNINSAFRLLPRLDNPAIRQFDALPAASYLALLNLVAFGVFFLPAVAVGLLLARRRTPTVSRRLT